MCLQAEDFSAAVQIVREWLPQAEHELKARPLPTDEESIGALIQEHERFEAELLAQTPNVERIRVLRDEIMQACNPGGVKFIKYYITITLTRWDQVLQRASHRRERLQEALRNIRGNAALLEELLAWLADQQALLNNKVSKTHI